MGIDEYATRLIRIKASQLVGRYGFTESDREDIEQQLRLDLLRRLPDFDPALGDREAFVTCRIEYAVARIVERRSAHMRDWRLHRSLHDTVADADGDAVERVETIPGPGPTPEQRDLRLDLAALVEDLPPEWRTVCRRLPYATVKEIAAELSVSRRTVTRWLCDIRERLRSAGFEDYL